MLESVFIGGKRPSLVLDPTRLLGREGLARALKCGIHVDVRRGVLRSHVGDSFPSGRLGPSLVDATIRMWPLSSEVSI